MESEGGDGSFGDAALPTSSPIHVNLRPQNDAADASSSAIKTDDDADNTKDATAAEADDKPSHPPPFLRFRLTYIDTVQSAPWDLPPAPTSADKTTPFIPARRIPFVPAGTTAPVERVPEIRIFGATEAGQRCCVHVHGAMPYVYVEYEGKVAPDEVQTYVARLARSINVCMAASLGRRDPMKSLFVAFIVPVKGVPFYGFHIGYRYFLKVYCLDTKFMTRLGTLLRSGEIMQKKFIVYEGHIPFLLQFMLDSNLYGCGWVEISKAKFRETVPEYADVAERISSAEQLANDSDPQAGQADPESDVSEARQHRKRPRWYFKENIPPDMLYSDPDLSPTRVSHSALEFDIHVSWILNRSLLKERDIHANFTEYLDKPFPENYKFVYSVRELWEDERRRRNVKGMAGPVQVSENSAEELGGLTAGPREAQDLRMYGIGTQPRWEAHSLNEQRFQDLLDKDRLAYLQSRRGDEAPAFETFAPKEKEGGWMQRIKTAFQSVTALFEETLEQDEIDENPFGAWGIKGVGVAMKQDDLDKDINPAFLNMLGSQAGRDSLLKVESEYAQVRQALSDLDENEEDAQSDEEETRRPEDKREVETALSDQVNATTKARENNAVPAEADSAMVVDTDFAQLDQEMHEDADLDLLNRLLPASFAETLDHNGDTVIRQLDIGSNGIAPVAIEKVSSTAASPKKEDRQSALPDTDNELYVARKRGSTVSPVKISQSPAADAGRIGPARVASGKSNLFSPAKSKLRHAIINPAFVTESRAKRKREDELIGFRAIGDHGRTKLQQMLQFNGMNQDPLKPVEESRSRSRSDLSGAAEVATASNEYQDHAETPTLSDSSGRSQSPVSVAMSRALSTDTETVQDERLDDVLPGHVADERDVRKCYSVQDVFPKTDGITPNPADVHSGSGNATPTQIVSSAEVVELMSPAITLLDLPAKVKYGMYNGRTENAQHSLPETPSVLPVPRAVHLQADRVSATTNRLATLDHLDKLQERADFAIHLPSGSTVADVADSVVSAKLSTDKGLPSALKWSLGSRPPSCWDIHNDLSSNGLPTEVYRDAYYSEAIDVPNRVFEYAGRRYVPRGDENRFFRAFEHHNLSEPGLEGLELPRGAIFGFSRWTYALRAPRTSEILASLESPPTAMEASAPADTQRIKLKRKNRAYHLLDHKRALPSQIQGPTQANPFGAKYSHAQPSNSVAKEKEHMSSLAIEIHVDTRGDLLPDPTCDEIKCIFYCLQNEDDDVPDNGRREGTHVGLIISSEPSGSRDPSVAFLRLGLSRYMVDVVDDEVDLVRCLVDKVRLWDPEIFTGFDVLKDSWGYLVERIENIAPELDIVTELSRVLTQSTGRKGSKNEDRWGYSKGSTLKITGRHVLPIWRLLKSDANLTIYSLENVCFHILRQRVPRFTFATLTSWYQSDRPDLISRVLRYHLLRAQLVIELLEEAEIVSRNAEFARVFGVDFHSVLTRGSQFKVESVMFKISKPENFMLPSPSREDVGKQNAAECMPLILEPESGFYSSPVLVFDFQSLYPSVMIAYNLCYSTCLGRLKEFIGTNRLGTSSLAIRPGTLTLLKDFITLSPNGLMFLKPQVRKSLLAKMLTEILDTRVMIKKSMKLVDSDDQALERLLNARQLGLKFIANVTYGYTSATFSGRMPCVEIADAIVQTGRETLERAKTTIMSRKDWGAVVRYGDTDSLFVHLPGKTKDEAFAIGNDIAETITRMNPKPVKLKFEKVYLPSFLLAKKRYVGFKYESAKDVKPIFDAKGIETVRRDGFPAMQKMLETCIKILFRTADLSAVKFYVQQQFSRIMQHRVSAQDFIYAKEVKMGSYSDKGIPPPGAVVTARRMLVDPRTEALYGERVPYIISKGMDGPNAKQAHRALTPEEFLADRDHVLDDGHYIGRIVKTLNRLFNLVGVDTQEWWNATPRRIAIGKSHNHHNNTRLRVDQHFNTAACAVCGAKKSNYGILCSDCLRNSTQTHLAAHSRLLTEEQRSTALASVCATCAQIPVREAHACVSTDCPNLYSRLKADREIGDLDDLLTTLSETSNAVSKHADFSNAADRLPSDDYDTDLFFNCDVA